MLTKVFTSALLTYAAVPGATFPNSGGNISPWTENFYGLSGLFTQPEPTTTGSDTLYMAGLLTTYGFNLTHEKFSLFSWDAKTGTFLTRVDFSPGALYTGGLIQSRLQNLYAVTPNAYSVGSLQKVAIVDLVTPQATILASFFGLTQFFTPALDENTNTLVSSSGTGPAALLNIYNLTTGALNYALRMPDTVIAVCLQNTNNMYVLCGNRVILTIDYTTGKILGAMKLQPSLVTGGDYPQFGYLYQGVTICFDSTMGRLLVAEQTANNSDGSPSIVVTGYTPSSVPVRLTTPIPLQSPLTGRTLPVLTGVVDDLNFGKNGYLVAATIGSGVGSIGGPAYTNASGQVKTPLVCGPTAGSGAIDCSIMTQDAGGNPVTLTSVGNFTVTPVSLQTTAASFPVYPAVGFPSGRGRLVHPSLGAFDYAVKPDSWLNMDADVIVAPTWAGAKGLTGASNTLFPGDITSVICEERWAGDDGMSMPISMLRMLLALWSNAIDPAVGLVQWFPNYANSNGYNVILSDLIVGSGGGSQMAKFSGVGYQTIELDDLINSLNVDGSNNGWVRKPVTLYLKMVSKI